MLKYNTTSRWVAVLTMHSEHLDTSTRHNVIYRIDNFKFVLKVYKVYLYAQLLVIDWRNNNFVGL